MNAPLDEKILEIGLKNIDLLNANVARFSSFLWIVKGWVVTAWGGVMISDIQAEEKKIILYFVVGTGFLISEVLRMLEKKTIELLMGYEKAMSMAMLGNVSDLKNLGFKTNLSNVNIDELGKLILSEKFSLTRIFFILCTLATLCYNSLVIP